MNNIKVVPGRMGLLVTMFLSLTTLLVGSVSQSPSVAQGVNALTAWMMVHYLFIITILLVYSYQLCIIRYIHNCPFLISLSLPCLPGSNLSRSSVLRTIRCPRRLNQLLWTSLVFAYCFFFTYFLMLFIGLYAFKIYCT